MRSIKDLAEKNPPRDEVVAVTANEIAPEYLGATGNADSGPLSPSGSVGSSSLFDLEVALVRLAEIDPEELGPEGLKELESAVLAAFQASLEKRDRIAWKLFDLGRRAAVKRAEAQSYIDKAEALSTAAKRIEAVADRLSRYVLEVMKATIPKPAKGPRRIEGATSTFTAKGVPSIVVVTEENAIPAKYMNAVVTVEVNGSEWEQMKTKILEVGIVPNATFVLDRRRLKAALEKPELVSGAHLETDRVRLEVT